MAWINAEANTSSWVRASFVAFSRFVNSSEQEDAPARRIADREEERMIRREHLRVGRGFGSALRLAECAGLLRHLSAVFRHVDGRLLDDSAERERIARAQASEVRIAELKRPPHAQIDQRAAQVEIRGDAKS